MKTYVEGRVWWKVALLYAFIIFVPSSFLIAKADHTTHPKAAQPIAVKSVAKDTQVSGRPSRIVINKASIDLPIVDGTYDSLTGQWSVSKTAANYATNTYIVNNTRGTTVLYGHDLPQIFQHIRMLNDGDTVRVYASNNYIFEYVYRAAKTRQVQPNNTSVFDNLNTDRPHLILLTCDGVWSQNRLVMEFDFKKVVKQ